MIKDTISSEATDYDNTFPRKGTDLYKRLFGDSSLNRKNDKRQRFFNKWFVTPFYRIRLLPLLGLGKFFLLIHHKGRISGKKYITPVNYIKYKDDGFYVMSARGSRSDWYKNLQASQDKTIIQVGLSTFPAKVRPLTREEKSDFWKWYVQNNRFAERMIGWNSEQDSIDSADFSKLIDLIPINTLSKV
ncbi:MAG: nitroreductase family deazaflavin-dependent oxidoreductase [Candidatus Hodarchaeales archaeon]